MPLPILEGLATPAAKAREQVSGYTRRTASGKTIHVSSYDRNVLRDILSDLLANSDDDAQIAKLPDGTQLRVTGDDDSQKRVEAKIGGTGSWTLMGNVPRGGTRYAYTGPAEKIRSKSAKLTDPKSFGGAKSHTRSSTAESAQDKIERERDGRPTARQEAAAKKKAAEQKREAALRDLPGSWMEIGDPFRDSSRSAGPVRRGVIPGHRIKRGNVVQIDTKPGAFIVVKRSGSKVWVKPYSEGIASRRSGAHFDHEGADVIQITDDQLKAIRGRSR